MFQNVKLTWFQHVKMPHKFILLTSKKLNIVICSLPINFILPNESFFFQVHAGTRSIFFHDFSPICFLSWKHDRYRSLYLKRHKRLMKCISEALLVIFYWPSQLKEALIQIAAPHVMFRIMSALKKRGRGMNNGALSL